MTGNELDACNAFCVFFFCGLPVCISNLFVGASGTYFAFEISFVGLMYVFMNSTELRKCLGRFRSLTLYRSKEG
jgi:hypothetical protein